VTVAPVRSISKKVRSLIPAAPTVAITTALGNGIT
jgi:hypothetical protein